MAVGRRYAPSQQKAPPPTPGVMAVEDRVFSFSIVPGTLGKLREAMAEVRARFLCHQGRVTLVSPGYPHESTAARIDSLILAACAVCRIPFTSLGSTYFVVPRKDADSGYEPDEGYYIQSHGAAPEGYRPDLAVEIVVSHSEKTALANGVLLKIPEIWVVNVPRQTLTFLHLIARGKHKGTYQPRARSRALPFLLAREVKERLGDPVADDMAFHENCRAWAEEVLLPRHLAL